MSYSKHSYTHTTHTFIHVSLLSSHSTQTSFHSTDALGHVLQYLSTQSYLIQGIWRDMRIKCVLLTMVLASRWFSLGWREQEISKDPNIFLCSCILNQTVQSPYLCSSTPHTTASQRLCYNTRCLFMQAACPPGRKAYAKTCNKLAILGDGFEPHVHVNAREMVLFVWEGFRLNSITYNNCVGRRATNSTVINSLRFFLQGCGEMGCI